jgi:hypothetical protein
MVVNKCPAHFKFGTEHCLHNSCTDKFICPDRIFLECKDKHYTSMKPMPEQTKGSQT